MNLQGEGGQAFPGGDIYPDTGTVIQGWGIRRSVGNDPRAEASSRQHLLEMMNANLMHRHKEQQEKNKKGTVRSRRDMLDELFGKG